MSWKQGVCVAAAVLGVLAARPARAGGHDGDREANDGDREALSPYIVGVWKFVPNGTQAPHVDTEFRFINPTKLDLILEYAFFELDGTFCGCDRDEFEPNKTTEYSMLDETQLAPPLAGGPRVFSCTGKSGALKSIVFRADGERLVLDKAVQVGFQVHAFGDVVEADSMIRGNVMTESGMLSVPINEATRREIQKIHEQCVTVNGPLGQ